MVGESKAWWSSRACLAWSALLVSPRHLPLHLLCAVALVQFKVQGRQAEVDDLVAGVVDAQRTLGSTSTGDEGQPREPCFLAPDNSVRHGGPTSMGQCAATSSSQPAYFSIQGASSCIICVDLPRT